MIYHVFVLEKQNSGQIIGHWEENGEVSQHNSGINGIKVKLTGFNLLPGESLYMAFSDSMEEDFQNIAITSYQKMENKFDNTYDIMIPFSVMQERGTWYACVGIFGDWVNDEPMTQMYIGPFTFDVTAKIKNINGKIATYGDIETIYNQAVSAVTYIDGKVVEVNQMKSDTQGYAEKAAASAGHALEYSNDSADSAREAYGYAQDASGSASKAQQSADRSNQDALKAKEYSEAAKRSETNSSNSEGNALIYKDSAQTSAELSEQKALESAESLSRIQQITNGIHKSLVFDTVQAFLLWWQNSTAITVNGQSYTKNDLNIGDDIYIIEEGYSDVWYTGQAETNPDTWWNGLPFTKLETDKTELISYTERAEIAKEQAEASALIAKNEADRAKSEADRATTQANRANDLKNQIDETYIDVPKKIDRIFDIIKDFQKVHKVDTYAQFAEDIENGISPDYVSPGDETEINWVNTITGTTTFGGTVTCTDEQAFVNGVGECEESEYKILFFEGKWYYDGEEISLNKFGLTVTGTPKNGDFIVVNVTVNKVNFTFVSYDTAVLGEKETGSHNWYLEETYCRLGLLNFDQPESVLCITPGNTLHEGKYFIRNVAEATGESWCNYKRLYYCFVVPHDITATETTGDIQLRRTSIGSRETTGDERGVYQIYCKPYGCKTDTLIEDITIEFVGQVAVPTEEYADLRTVAGFTVNQNMDSTGIIYNNIGHACYGNNDFLRSNICQYLNSDEKSIIPVRQHKNDVVDSIAGKKGYLYGLDPRVKKILAKNKIKLQHGASDEYPRYADFTFEKTVSLLTMKEMSFKIQTTEGAVTQLYNELTSGALNNGAIAARAKYEKEGGSLVFYRWSSSADVYSSNFSRTVTSTGSNYSHVPIYMYFFAPAFIFAKKRNIKNLMS